MATKVVPSLPLFLIGTGSASGPRFRAGHAEAGAYNDWSPAAADLER